MSDIMEERFEELVLKSIPCLYPYKDDSIEAAMHRDARNSLLDFIRTECALASKKAVEEVMESIPSARTLDKYFLQYDKGYNHCHGDFMSVLQEALSKYKGGK